MMDPGLMFSFGCGYEGIGKALYHKDKADFFWLKQQNLYSTLDSGWGHDISVGSENQHINIKG